MAASHLCASRAAAAACGARDQTRLCDAAPPQGRKEGGPAPRPGSSPALGFRRPPKKERFQPPLTRAAARGDTGVR